MAEEKRCLKFTGYLYLPKKGEDLRGYAALLGVGTIHLFDEHNEKKKATPVPFGNVGQMLDIIAKEYKRRVYKRTKKH